MGGRAAAPAEDVGSTLTIHSPFLPFPPSSCSTIRQSPYPASVLCLSNSSTTREKYTRATLSAACCSASLRHTRPISASDQSQ